MKRVRTRLSAIALAATLGAAAIGTVGTPAHALGNPAIPQLTFDHTITSHPFTGAPRVAASAIADNRVRTRFTCSSQWTRART